MNQTWKHKEIEDIAKTVIVEIQHRDKLVSPILDYFCQITEPKFPEIEKRFDYINIGSEGFGGGESIKPGNIILNWRRLFESVPNIVLAGAGGISSPWLIPLAALVIWNEVWKQSKITISNRHAVVLWSSWEDRNDQFRIERHAALKATNKRLREYGWDEMSEAEFHAILDDLEKIECIEVSIKDIWLREWVKKSYH